MTLKSIVLTSIAVPIIAFVCRCSAAAGNLDTPTATTQPDTGLDASAPSGDASVSPPPTGTFTPTPVEPPPQETTDAMACAAVSQAAEQTVAGKADIIIAVDTSPSMLEETQAVQQNLNRFAQQIVTAGIDVHVVLIASRDVCIAAPLGSGTCGGPLLGGGNADDTNLPQYLHVSESVGSTTALADIQNTYPSWSSSLRPDAQKHIFVVTDDNSNMSAADFTTWVQSVPLLSMPSMQFSGMFCQQFGGNCARAGTVYDELVSQTGGVFGDLSTLSDPTMLQAEFDRVFNDLADVVVAQAVPVDCEWEIPPPPDGEMLDPNTVNLRYTSADGTAQTIYAVDQASDCDAQYGGWYFDDLSAPTHVLVCDSTCAIIQADLQAQIDLLFGCEREVLIR